MLSRILSYLEFIKVSHTLFALPFCLISAILAMREAAFNGRQMVWIVSAFVFARAFAMAMNRILDREYDALNPRTSGRHLPVGSISPGGAAAFASICGLFFVASAAQFSTLCGFLSVPTLACLAFYSWTKRFTQWSHLVLGGGLAMAPIGAEIAIRGAVSIHTAVLAAAVLFWVAGFDIFYACQDIDFDRKTGLFSVPARMGQERAIRMAGAFHVAAFILFLLFGHLANLGKIFMPAQIVIAALLVYEQILARKNKIEPAFFQLNGMISLVQLGAVALEAGLR